MSGKASIDAVLRRISRHPHDMRIMDSRRGQVGVRHSL